MNRKSLWILLWVTVSGFGLSWLGVQNLLLRQSFFSGKSQLSELERVNEEHSIRRVKLELILSKTGFENENLNSLAYWGNSGAGHSVLPLILKERNFSGFAEEVLNEVENGDK